jgi:hypothetical protein
MYGASRLASHSHLTIARIDNFQQVYYMNIFPCSGVTEQDSGINWCNMPFVLSRWPMVRHRKQDGVAYAPYGRHPIVSSNATFFFFFLHIYPDAGAAAGVYFCITIQLRYCGRQLGYQPYRRMWVCLYSNSTSAILSWLRTCPASCRDLFCAAWSILISRPIYVQHHQTNQVEIRGTGAYYIAWSQACPEAGRETGMITLVNVFCWASGWASFSSMSMCMWDCWVMMSSWYLLSAASTSVVLDWEEWDHVYTTRSVSWGLGQVRSSCATRS